MAAQEVIPEPLIDVADIYTSWDMTLPLSGINLIGLPGGQLEQPEILGGNEFTGVRDMEDGDDANDIDFEATAEDPNQWPQIRVNHPKIKPTIWLASDMLTQHQGGIDGYYDKRTLALSAIFAVLKTALIPKSDLPTAIVAANDHVVDMTPYPSTGSHQVLNIADKLETLLTPTHPLPEIDDRPKLSELLGYIGEKASRSVVVVVSDFRGINFWPDTPGDNWQGELERISGKKNEIIAIEVTSPEDSSMSEHLHTINHSPFGRIWAGKRGNKYRNRYEENAPEQQQAIDRALSEVGAIHVRLQTDEPTWESSLRDQLKYPELRVA